VEHWAFLDSGVPGLDTRRQAWVWVGHCASFRAPQEVRVCCNQFHVGFHGLVDLLANCQPRHSVFVFINSEYVQGQTLMMKMRNDKGCTLTGR
jgi:hypothetical protein